MSTLSAIFVAIAAALAALTGLYFLAPGVVLRGAIWLARRTGNLRLREVEIDGHHVPYLEGGSGEPLLLLHGFAANKDHWTMIAPFLTGHYHVYVPDLPGFGDATRDAQADYGLTQQLARILAFADTLGLERFHLGGNSMGGYLAAMLAAREPARVASLWLLAPAGVLSSQPSETLRLIEAGDNPLVAQTVAEFDRLSGFCFHRAPPMPAQFKRPLVARARAEAAFNHKMFSDLFTDPVPLEDRIDGLATRTLVVWGDDDRILHCSGLEVLRGLLADAEFILMVQMGHVPMIERPAETAADYLRFRQALT